MNKIIKKLERVLKHYTKEFKEDHKTTYRKARTLELEEMEGIMSYDCGYLDCLQDTLFIIKEIKKHDI